MKIASAILSAGLAFASSAAFAQETRSALTTYNNANIFQNSQGLVTPQIINNLFGQIISAGGIQGDTNAWTQPNSASALWTFGAGATLTQVISLQVRSGVSTNTDLTGRITLSGGAFTYTLLGTYATAPNCVTQDVTTPANSSFAVEGTTNIVFHGTGTDVLKYHCVGLN